MQKITPFLWFDNNAEEAMNFYVNTFNNGPTNREESKILNIKYYPTGMTEEHMINMEGKVLTGVFLLEGQKFMCLDGGPVFTINEAVSFHVSCKDQAEIDYYWSGLSHVPEAEQCGWCKDKFGVSWQIIPENMHELLQSPAAIQAMMAMQKVDIAGLAAAQ